ncbi:MAG: hypothetical protein K2F81_07970 [Ruminococcus sp.]|nr:hypothetical protein [Ruminococcus sp.]
MKLISPAIIMLNITLICTRMHCMALLLGVMGCYSLKSKRVRIDFDRFKRLGGYFCTLNQ